MDLEEAIKEFQQTKLIKVIKEHCPSQAQFEMTNVQRSSNALAENAQSSSKALVENGRNSTSVDYEQKFKDIELKYAKAKEVSRVFDNDSSICIVDLKKN